MREVRTVRDIGQVVRGERRERGWTQADLAQRIGASRQWVVALESGCADRAELGRVLTALSALDLTLPELDHVTPAVDVVPDEPFFDLDAHLASFVRFDRAALRPGGSTP